MTRRHHYSPDTRGSVRKAISDAVDDRTALDAGSGGGGSKSGCSLWALYLPAICLVAIPVVGMVVGNLLLWWAG